MKQKIRRFSKVLYIIFSIIVIIIWLVLLLDLKVYRWDWYDSNIAYIVLWLIVTILWLYILWDILHRLIYYIDQWKWIWYINYTSILVNYFLYCLWFTSIIWILVYLWNKFENECTWQYQVRGETWSCTCNNWGILDGWECVIKNIPYSKHWINFSVPSNITVWDDYNSNIYVTKETRQSLSEKCSTLDWRQWTPDDQKREIYTMVDNTLNWKWIYNCRSELLTWYYMNIWWYNAQVVVSYYTDSWIPLGNVDYDVYIFKWIDDIIHLSLDSRFWNRVPLISDYEFQNIHESILQWRFIPIMEYYTSWIYPWVDYSIYVENDRIIRNIISSIDILWWARSISRWRVWEMSI